jgi:hypothetical protein
MHAGVETMPFVGARFVPFIVYFLWRPSSWLCSKPREAIVFDLHHLTLLLCAHYDYSEGTNVLRMVASRTEAGPTLNASQKY